MGKCVGTVKCSPSMGILLPMEGKVAEEFLRVSEEATITKDTIEKCRELLKDVKIEE